MLNCLLILLSRALLKPIFPPRKYCKIMFNFTVAEMLVNSLISRLDNCNALLARVSKSTLNMLLYVQNSAASILTGTRIGSHITPVLESLHWLPVRSAFPKSIVSQL